MALYIAILIDETLRILIVIVFIGISVNKIFTLNFLGNYLIEEGRISI